MMFQARSAVRRWLIAALSICSMGGTAIAQLNPPPGPVAPSMKRLDQIEPRICLNDLEGSPDSVIHVRFPGKYYVTRAIHGESGKHGVLIDPAALEGGVTIDLNGFELVGVPGSLDGIHARGGGGGGGGGAGGTLRIVAPRDPPSGRPTGQRMRSWGGNGVDVGECSSCTIAGLEVDGCGGVGVTVAGVNDVEISSCSVSRCAGGIEIRPGGGGGGGVAERCDARVIDVTVRDCFGNAVACSGVSVQWVLEVRVQRVEMKRCAGGGLVVDDAAVCEIGECLAADLDGDGLAVTNCPRLQFQPEGTKGVRVRGCTGNGVSVRLCQEATLTRCAVEDCDGDGVHVEDCASLRCEDVAVADCDGDGLECTRTATVDAQGPTISRCGGRGLAFDTCTSVSLHRVAVGDVTGDGIACSSVADLDCDGRSEIARCGGNGVELLDCDDVHCSDMRTFECTLDGWHDEDCDSVSLSRVSIADCDGDGIDSSWTAASSGHAIAIGHDFVSVSRCLGAGIRCVSDAPECVMSVTQSNCDVSLNGGAGCRIVATASGRIDCVCTESWYHDNGGAGLIWSPRSNIVLRGAMTDSRCSNNGGDGFACVSSTQGVVLSESCRIDMSGSSFTANGGNGCVSQCPVRCSTSSFCENGGNGMMLTGAHALTSMCTANACTHARNASHGVYVSRGRYASTDCNFEDCGGDGVRCDEGCVLMTTCTTNRCGGDGVSVTGTLTVESSSFRRCDGAGVRCSDGSCRASGMVCDLNGGGGGGGGGALFLRCPSVQLEHCSFSENIGPGVECRADVGAIRAGIMNCMASNNTSHGFDMDNCSGGQMVACRALGNGAFGMVFGSGWLHGHIQDNTCTDNAGGIQVAGTGNLVISNSVTCGPLGCISVTQGNAAGPIIDSANLATDCNPRANVVH